MLKTFHRFPNELPFKYKQVGISSKPMWPILQPYLSCGTIIFIPQDPALKKLLKALQQDTVQDLCPNETSSWSVFAFSSPCYLTLVLQD